MEGVQSKSGAKKTDCKASVTKPKMPKSPVYPLSATAGFICGDFWQNYMQRNDYPTATVVWKAGLEQWEAMTDVEQAPFIEEARKKMAEHRKEMEEYSEKLREYAKLRTEYREDYYRRYAAGEVEKSYSDDYTDSEEEDSESEEAAGEEDHPMDDVESSERLIAAL